MARPRARRRAAPAGPGAERSGQAQPAGGPLPVVLRYVDDTEPGIRRRRCGSGFAYLLPDGSPVRDPETLARIRALAIPPAYRDVWICRDAAGHLQATGRDARGRKQYRYHPQWRAERDADKYDRMIAFGQALPRLRRRVSRDLARPGLPREKVLATVVRLLEATLIRVGNEEYARANRSYGLTTLRTRHVKVERDAIRFEFRGKRGVMHRVQVQDARLAGVLRGCLHLPGQELFQYVDGEGTRHAVTSSDVNDYLHHAMGAEFTAKDFRTWFGSLAALECLVGRCPASVTEGRREVMEALRAVARRLRNTPAICRKCYVHPGVIEAYQGGALAGAGGARMERQLLELLQAGAGPSAG